MYATLSVVPTPQAGATSWTVTHEGVLPVFVNVKASYLNGVLASVIVGVVRGLVLPGVGGRYERLAAGAVIGKRHGDTARVRVGVPEAEGVKVTGPAEPVHLRHLRHGA